MATDSIFMRFVDTGTLGRVFSVLGLFITYTICLVLYRLYLHPLAQIPGPKIAGITALYAMYHDLMREGTYVWVVEDMHKKYGPIVRIRPNTAHINDAGFLDQVYGVAGKHRNKSKLHCNALMTPGAFVATSDHDLHRNRRAPVSPFFSKQSVRRLEPILQRCLGKILDRFEQHAVNHTPLNLKLLFTASTCDIITEYAFGNCWNNLDVPDLNERFFQVMSDASRMWHISSYFPWVMNIFTTIPEKVAIWLAPDMEVLLPHFAVLENQLEDIRASLEDMKVSKGDCFRSIFQALLDSKLPDSEKSNDRLFCESRVILAAGTDTTGTMLTKIVFHLLSAPEALKKLREELEIAIPDPNTPPTSAQVENLPYLNAIIEETLRLHPSGSMRQERFAPDEDLVYINDTGTKYYLPRGTNMAMTAPLLSRNAELYPNPQTWRPERFLENPHLGKHSLTFSRGTRICLGMNLAYAELYMVIAGIFRKYGVFDAAGGERGPTLELWETTREDVDMVRDFAVPFVREGSRGVSVVVRN